MLRLCCYCKCSGSALKSLLFPPSPQTATKELLEASQAEVGRLREVVAHLQAKSRCLESSQRPSLGMNVEIARRLEELAAEVQKKELEFRKREQAVSHI